VGFHLFHGTTLAAAERIVDNGWVRSDVPSVIGRLAEAHGVDIEAVQADLESYHRFVLADGRGRYVSFCTDPLKAEHNWAQRAPEAEWEILWAIWRLENGVRAPEPWNTLVEGHPWVWEQSRSQPLAVVAVDITRTELGRHGAMEGGFGLRPLRDTNLNEIPDVAIPLPFKPAGDRIVIRPVERHVRWDVFALLLGMAPEQFLEAATAGEFGPPASDALGSSPGRYGESPPWWTSSQVDAYLGSR
jgi:hypothetical protein